MAVLSRRLILLAILLYMYEQFRHHTQMNLSPNIQLLSPQQSAYQSFSSLKHPGIVVAHWVYFRDYFYMNMNYSYPTSMYESIFAQMYIFLVEK